MASMLPPPTTATQAKSLCRIDMASGVRDYKLLDQAKYESTILGPNDYHSFEDGKTIMWREPGTLRFHRWTKSKDGQSTESVFQRGGQHRGGERVFNIYKLTPGKKSSGGPSNSELMRNYQPEITTWMKLTLSRIPSTIVYLDAQDRFKLDGGNYTIRRAGSSDHFIRESRDRMTIHEIPTANDLRERISWLSATNHEEVQISLVDKEERMKAEEQDKSMTASVTFENGWKATSENGSRELLPDVPQTWEATHGKARHRVDLSRIGSTAFCHVKHSEIKPDQSEKTFDTFCVRALNNSVRMEGDGSGGVIKVDLSM
ncbi:hypothetical protein L486_05171 [Kwoniella mangroviensis CBS 10435]|uniref:Uncharacterized protein n=1 Tax=Kwoniella mangroviensis CBS 10435 TaxID=1331196 RepID=A0A1B9IQB3_9TREE|nr:hypothetical protein L486_05171 [Kwoniella mangroviensis CBS 10435]